MYHGAEISLLRDLHRNRETLAGAPQVTPKGPALAMDRDDNPRRLSG